MTVQNCLTRAGLTTRRMIAYQHGLQKAFKETVTDEPVYESVQSVMTNTVQDVVDHLLFLGAAPLPDGVVGHEAFRLALAAGAPRSAEGHTLKDLYLQGRLFRFRQHLIYSTAFRGLPDTLKLRVLDRLRTELQSTDPNGRYAYIPGEERQQILLLPAPANPPRRPRALGGGCVVRPPDLGPALGPRTAADAPTKARFFTVWRLHEQRFRGGGLPGGKTSNGERPFPARERARNKKPWPRHKTHRSRPRKSP